LREGAEQNRLTPQSGKVIGRIMRHPQASKDLPWFSTITAREQPPSVYNRGYAVSRKQAMRYFKARYMAP
jgi:alkylated DNA nucleotide flippase Atl1